MTAEPLPSSFFLLPSSFLLLTSPRHTVLFFEARFETFQIYRDPWLRVFRGRPQILHRPRDWLVQFSSGSQWPIRIAQKLARHDHCISLFRPNDVLRLIWRSDHP